MRRIRRKTLLLCYAAGPNHGTGITPAALSLDRSVGAVKLHRTLAPVVLTEHAPIAVQRLFCKTRRPLLKLLHGFLQKCQNATPKITGSVPGQFRYGDVEHCNSAPLKPERIHEQKIYIYIHIYMHIIYIYLFIYRSLELNLWCSTHVLQVLH